MKRIRYFITNILNRDIANQTAINFQGLKNLPTLERVVVQISFKPNFFRVNKTLPFMLFVLEYLTGQKPVFSFSTEDVAPWKLRKKQLVSIHTTLRGDGMLVFIEKLLFTYIPKLIQMPTYVIAPNTSSMSLIIPNFMLFSELERENMGFTKKNSIICKYTLGVVLVFKEQSQHPFNNPLIIINQLKFPGQN